MTTRTKRPKNRDEERRQQVADVYIDVAQFLHRLAEAYKERARNYRAGTLLVAYENLPPDAGDHMRHPVQRAIDSLSKYDVVATYERADAALRDIK